MHGHDTASTAILEWLAAIGAAGAGEVASVCGLSARAASARLRLLERAGLTRSARLLHGTPALHVLTRAGLRAAGRSELAPVAVTAGSFAHQMAIAQVAAGLAVRCGQIGGERDLRAAERAAGRPLASAEVGYAADGSRALHRPDLVVWREPSPVAVEVELTVKAPERLRAIVRGWARSRLVLATVYYAAPAAARAVATAVRREQAAGRVVVLPLPSPEWPFPDPATAGTGVGVDRRVPSQARRTVAGRTDPRTEGDPDGNDQSRRHRRTADPRS